MLNALERKLGRFAVPHLTVVLVLGQLMFYVASLGKPDFLEMMPFVPERVLAGEWWRVFTFLFVPFTINPLFLFFALYLFWLFGETMENHWGTFRYNVYVLIVVLLSMAGALVDPAAQATNWPIKASVFFAFAFLYPDFELHLFFILPVKVKWLALITAGFVLAAALNAVALGRWGVALGGVSAFVNFLLFFGLDSWRIVRRGARRMHQQQVAIVNDEEPMHQCVQCKRTDLSDPALDFRYFKREPGVQCFCSDHYPEPVPEA